MTDLQTYCKRLKIPIRMLKSRSQKADIATARQVWWYYLYEVGCHRTKYGYTMKAIGKMFNRHNTTVTHGIKRIKDLISLNDNYLKRFLEAINND